MGTSRPERQPRPWEGELAKLREQAPPQDRNDAALQPKRYAWEQAAPNSIKSLDELRAACAPHGEAAAQEAIWEAVIVWSMHLSPTAKASLTNTGPVVALSLVLCQQADRERLGYPLPQHNNLLATLSPDAQAEARLVAEETQADWERAGRPYLTALRFQQIRQHVQRCTAPIIQEIAA